MDNPPVGTTYRTKDKRDRITFDPEGSISRPWALFINGTAVNRFEHFGLAAEFAKRRYASVGFDRVIISA
jgi:hypothetical protein